MIVIPYSSSAESYAWFAELIVRKKQPQATGTEVENFDKDKRERRGGDANG